MTGEGLRGELLATVGGASAFESSFNWRTFQPAKRAHSEIEEAVQDVTTGATAIYEADGSADMVADWSRRYIAKWAKYQAAGALTVNWMIIGPANFPLERNRKRMDVEHRRAVELSAHVDGAAEWARRQIHRAARVKLAAADTAEHQERTVGGVRLIHNTTLDRVQLVFPGRPSNEDRAVLKKHAFRWAPSLGVWQRQLTANGVRAAVAVLKAIGNHNAPVSA